jgi:hypothetical protein
MLEWLQNMNLKVLEWARLESHFKSVERLEDSLPLSI